MSFINAFIQAAQQGVQNAGNALNQDVVKPVENAAQGVANYMGNAWQQSGVREQAAEDNYNKIQQGQKPQMTPQQAADERQFEMVKSGGLVAPEANVGKAAFNVVDKVVAPDAAKSLYGLEHTQAIQDALKRNGVSDYSQIGQAARNLYEGTIKPILTTSPKLVSMDDLTNKIVTNMRKLKPGLDVNEAKRAASGVITDLYNIARGDNGAPVPTHIDTPSIFNLKQDLNNTTAVKNFFNGNPISDLTDLATIAARNTMGDVIQGAHPEIAQATKDYGLLQDAVPSIYKATEQAAKDAANAAPADPMGYLGGKALDYLPFGKLAHDAGNAVLTNPVGQKVLGLAGAAGLGALGMQEVPNLLGNHHNSEAEQPQGQGNIQVGSNNSHTYSITQGVNKDGFMYPENIPADTNSVKLNNDGTVTIANPTMMKDSTGSVIAMSQNDYNKQVRAIQDDIIKQNEAVKANPLDPEVTGSAKAAIDADNAQLQSLETINKSSEQLNRGYQYANSIIGNTNAALQTLNSSSLNVSDLSSKIDTLQNSLDPSYSKLKQSLSKISQQIGGGNLDVKTKSALASVLRTINQQTAYDYYNAAQSYMGAPTSQTNSMAPNSSGIPSFPIQGTAPSAPSGNQDFSNITGGQAPVLQFPQQP